MHLSGTNFNIESLMFSMTGSIFILQKYTFFKTFNPFSLEIFFCYHLPCHQQPRHFGITQDTALLFVGF